MIKVWGRMTSNNVQKVMWCIDELAVPHEHIDLQHGQAKQDAAYLAMNPNGLVPIIEDDGFILWESNSCVRYIAAKFGAGTLYPTDLRQRADAERWMDWAQTALSAPSWTIFLGLVLQRPEQRDIDAITAASKRFNELWSIADEVLATRKYVAGDQFTIGDIPMGIAAYRWFNIPVERAHHPHFEDWYARLTERPAFRKNVIRPLL